MTPVFRLAERQEPSFHKSLANAIFFYFSLLGQIFEASRILNIFSAKERYMHRFQQVLKIAGRQETSGRGPSGPG